MNEVIQVILVVLSILLFIASLIIGISFLQGYAKIDNVCADLGITNMLKCGLIDPDFQGQDIQQRIIGDLNINLE